MLNIRWKKWYQVDMLPYHFYEGEDKEMARGKAQLGCAFIVKLA